MSCSGGEASLIADSAVGRNVSFRDLKPEQIPVLRETLGQMVTLSNPLDYHTFVWGNGEKQTIAFTTMMQGGYALNMLILDFPRTDRCNPADWMVTAARTRPVRIAPRMAVTAKALDSVAPGLLGVIMKRGVVESS